MAAHEKELADLASQMESEKTRQILATREKLAEKRRKKMEELRRRQEVELTKEALEQQKELDEMRLKRVCL